MQRTVAAIYAVSENGIIGKNNQLPWNLPGDMRFFMRKTRGHTVIMGRKSYEALGKALPHRRNIIITRQENFSAEGCEIVSSLEAALQRCRHDPEVWITGGAGIYREAIEKGYVDLILETLVHADVDGDVAFSLPHPEQWEIIATDARQADAKNEFAYTFRILAPKTRVEAALPDADEYASFYAGYVNHVGRTYLPYLLKQDATRIRDFFTALPPDKETYAYAPGKWTPREILGHISDTERIMAYRALRIARGDETPLPGFEENSYVAAAGFNERSMEDLLDEFDTVRSATLSLVNSLSPDVLANRGTASQHSISVRALLYIIVGHAQHHEAVIREKYV